MLNSKTAILKSHKNGIGIICLRRDGILTFVPDKNTKNTSIKILIEDLAIFTEWTKLTGPIPFLIDSRNFKQLSTEERIYIQKNLPIFASKYGVIVKDGLSSFFYNLIAHLNQPEIPMKAFSDIDGAFKWLKE